MIIGIAGEAGAGKDTVAGFIQRICPSAIAIAQADPMKRFVARVFDFTEHQLWGPSEARNGGDERFAEDEAWKKAEMILSSTAYSFVEEVLPDLSPSAITRAVDALKSWFRHLYAAHMDYALVSDAFVMKNTTKQILTPRYVLQTLGTEWGRAVDADMWSKYSIRLANKLLGGGQRYSRSEGVIVDLERGIPDFILVTDVRFPNEIVNLAQVGAERLLVYGPGLGALQGGVAGHSSEALLKKIPRHWYTTSIYNNKAAGLESLELTVRQYVLAQLGKVL